MSRNRFLESMIGWLVLTLTVFILILSCNTTSLQKPYWKKSIPSTSVNRILNEEITFEMYKDYAVCANGAMYRKDVKGFLPELMDKIYNEAQNL